MVYEGQGLDLALTHRAIVACQVAIRYNGLMSKRKIKAVWSDPERQAFADGFRFRAVRFLDRRKQTAKYLCRDRVSRFRDE